jgi:prevent-host-death family protein
MPPAQTMSVSELKNRLLEVVRRVEKGEAFQITKGGELVAILSPSKAKARPATGFAHVEIKGSLELPAAGWTYDVDNLKPRRKRRA